PKDEPSAIPSPHNPTPGLPIMNFSTRALSRTVLLVTALLALAAQPSRAAEEEAKGPAISVLKATKACFSNIVEVNGTILARDEPQTASQAPTQAQVRPDRPGLKVAEIAVDPGETVTAGQVLARLVVDGGLQNVTAPYAGLVISSSAVVGAVASARGEALFTILTRYDYDLISLVPVADLGK